MIDTNPLAELPPFKFNRLLHGKLSDDEQRAELYRQLHDEGRLQVFRSPADAHAGSGSTPLFNQQVVLLSERAHVLQALTDDHHFSNAPYRTLGSGTFMLGLDGMAHAEQLGFARRALRFSPAEIQVLAALAWSAARVVPLQTRRFDAALLAEQVALRYAALLFGFPLSEHPYLEAAMRAGYQQLVYQIIGRHFSLDLALEPRAKAAGGALLQHTVDLLNRYAAGEVPDDLGELRRAPGLAEFRPVCQRVAEDPGEQSATELAVIVCGLIAGAIGNVQACVAIALDAIVSAPVGAAPRPGLRPTGSIDSPLGDVGRLARSAEPGSEARAELQRRVLDALALNPPAAFLPRQVVAEVALSIDGREVARLQPGTQVLLAIGGATRQGLGDPQLRAAPGGDPLIFGGGPRDGAGADAPPHACVGEHLALPLVVETVRQVLMLPGITAAIDARTGEPCRLKKTWGFRCDELLLEYSHELAVVQQPLSIVMKLKAPVAESAAKLRQIIAAGAPRIEFRLKQSQQVHFAWFLLLDDDSKLALFTTFDGDFDVYIEHFAREVGPLFDKLFECLEDPPPQPVAQNPQAFVETVRRYNVTPVASYFFSAYPLASVSTVQQALQRRSA